MTVQKNIFSFLVKNLNSNLVSYVKREDYVSTILVYRTKLTAPYYSNLHSKAQQRPRLFPLLRLPASFRGTLWAAELFASQVDTTSTQSAWPLPLATQKMHRFPSLGCLQTILLFWHHEHGTGLLTASGRSFWACNFFLGVPWT